MSGPIGKPLPRKEDRRLLTGEGHFTDDISLPGQLHCVFVRSPHAHAVLRGVDCSAALASPGVVAVLTGADYLADGFEPQGATPILPADILEPTKPGVVPSPGTEAYPTPLYAVAVGKVRRVGECVALCVAETRAEAQDAAELVAVDYEVLPAVVDLEAAVAPGAPQIWDNVPGNVTLHTERGDAAATDAAFADAAHVVSLRLRNNRVAPVTMEPRGQVVSFDPETDELTLYNATSRTVLLRTTLARFLGLPVDKAHVYAGDAGGSYGLKTAIYAEYFLTTWASRRLGRPIKWISDRSEAMVSDNQARELETSAALALDGDGRFLGLRVSHLYAVGCTANAYSPLSNGMRVITNVYDIPAAYLSARAVVTNTLPTSVYRGAGRPEAVYNIERLIDCAAAELGIDRVELRRRNLIRPEALPYTNPMGIPYDSGEFEAMMDDVLARADWAGFGARRERSHGRGLLRGIGMANYIQTPTGHLIEWTAVHVHSDGRVEVCVGTDSSGQGHETSFAQVVAQWLGVDIEQVAVIEGNTDVVKDGGGSHSDRSMRLAGAIMTEAADAIVEKGRGIAGHLLEAAADDIAYADGRFTIKGTDRSVGLFEVAHASETGNLPGGIGGPLREEANISRRLPAYPCGCAICEVELDPETGQVSIDRYVSVDDVGRAINPMIVDGQTAGAIVQGIGQALLEEVLYDSDSGQLVTGSFMDYALPRADDLPSFSLKLHEVPAPSNRLGVKGGGEGGTLSALGAVMNAVNDALRDFGAAPVGMPATSERIWQAIRDARRESPDGDGHAAVKTTPIVSE